MQEFDAALKDYNTVLGLYPNNIRAHVGRGLLFEKRRNLDQARADYRSASVVLTKFDDPDVAKARATAQDRLAALTAGLIQEGTRTKNSRQIRRDAFGRGGTITACRRSISRSRTTPGSSTQTCTRTTAS